MNDVGGPAVGRVRDGEGPATGVTRRLVSTNPVASAPRLRGRTYAIPFGIVWHAALSVAREEMRGWTVIGADDELGIIEIESARILGRQPLKVEVVIGLDGNGQTRVDLRSEAPRTAPGRSLVFERFLRRLQVAANATPGLVIDPTDGQPWPDSS